MLSRSIKLLIILIGFYLARTYNLKTKSIQDEIEDSIKIRRINFGLK